MCVKMHDANIVVCRVSGKFETTFSKIIYICHTKAMSARMNLKSCLQTIIFTTFLIYSGNAVCQTSQILSENIRTLQVLKNSDWMELPVIELGSDDRISISFDELSHRNRRLVYRISHCLSDWTESGLSEQEFMDGFNGLPITDYRNSVNTTMLYTHYRLEIPNDDVRLLVSGNYEVTVSDGTDFSELLKARFAVLERGCSVTAQVSGNTDADTNDKNQQLSVTVGFSSLQTSRPEREIIVNATQNRRSDIMVTSLEPSYITGSQLQFVHNRRLIFAGGNEYRRFEVVNMYNYSRNVDRIDFFDPYFHATLMEDRPHWDYIYDQDHNGRFLIRYNRSDDSDMGADYLFVHFVLRAPHYLGGRLYLDGDFTYGSLGDEWEMVYNDRSGCYEKAVLLKMGAYDYRYLWVPEGSSKGMTFQTEGDSFETSNEYQVFVWFRQFGSRYDRLVGLADLRMAK